MDVLKKRDVSRCSHIRKATKLGKIAKELRTCVYSITRRNIHIDARKGNKFLEFFLNFWDKMK